MVTQFQQTFIAERIYSREEIIQAIHKCFKHGYVIIPLEIKYRTHLQTKEYGSLNYKNLVAIRALPYYPKPKKMDFERDKQSCLNKLTERIKPEEYWDLQYERKRLIDLIPSNLKPEGILDISEITQYHDRTRIITRFEYLDKNQLLRTNNLTLLF